MHKYLHYAHTFAVTDNLIVVYRSEYIVLNINAKTNSISTRTKTQWIKNIVTILETDEKSPHRRTTPTFRN